MARHKALLESENSTVAILEIQRLRDETTAVEKDRRLRSVIEKINPPD